MLNPHLRPDRRFPFEDMDNPPPHIRSQMHRRFREIFAMGSTSSLSLSLVELTLYELLGNWQTSVVGVHFIVSEVLARSGQGNKTDKNWAHFCGLCLFRFPMFFQLGGFALLLATHHATSDDVYLAEMGASPYIRQYILRPDYVRKLTFAMTLPHFLAWLFVSPTYAKLCSIISSWKVRLLLLAAVQIWCPDPLFAVVARFFVQAICHYLSKFSRRLIKLCRLSLLVALNKIDAVGLVVVWILSWVAFGRTEPYRYSVLASQKRKFHVLLLEPGSGPVLRCGMRTASLKNHGKKGTYEAVSYRWGSSTATYPILMDKKRFLVSEMVFTLLKGMRLRDRTRII